jgi:hypothetical protein
MRRLLLPGACLSLLLQFHALAGNPPTGNPYLHLTAADGTLRFDLSERIQHRHFWWPLTLLNYHVVLAGESAPADTWTLTEETTGKQLPLQISDLRKINGKPISATVSFFSDLPTGGHYSFLLKTKNPSKGDKADPGHDLVATTDGQTVLDTGSLKIRLPASQSIAPGTTAPGPITAVNDGKGWVGESSIDSPVKRVTKVTTEVLDKGPLFARARVTYEFESGGRYTATIKAPLGFSFVEFNEEFSGLTVGDKAAFHFLWTGLPLTQRNGEPIDRPHTLYYRGEDPHFAGPDHVENPQEEFYYRLGHCAADNTVNRTSADFSNPSSGRSVGLCVLDGSKWSDGGYSIWASSDTLAVRFRNRDGRLEWLLPLAGKSRQLGITAYDQQDPRIAEVLSHFSSYADNASIAASLANRGVANGRDLTSFVNSRYGGMSLDVVKDWVLSYPDNGRKSSAADLLPDDRSRRNLESIESYTKALWGDNETMHAEGNWFSPVSLRQVHQWIVPGFNKFRDQMTPELRARVTALLLFQSYLAGREEISPMRRMLKGHPNFMADWKYPLMMSPYFFPDHPMAAEWADQWEKFVELAGVFYVRPNVPAWDAKGGRWTENIGTYNWAFIEPVTKANDLGLLYDGHDRIPSPGQDLHGSYLAGTVTAPIKLGTNGIPFDFTPGTPLLPQNGFQRIHPQMGAHSSRRKVPDCIGSFAEAFRNYDPLVAEHMLWINRRPEGSPLGFESDKGKADARLLSVGTNPRLRSAKYTGYGFILRSAVDTTNEISVYLEQVDKGPNYRWGFGNENSGGDIYYYAGGNSYTGHFNEDAGDRHLTDTEVTCNTGVYKDSTFRGLGMNDLTEPLYDLGGAQFAEILARRGPDAYSWPEYESRSVMLVGHDYIITFDAVNNMSRLSWNTMKGQDKLPTIIPIRGEYAYRTTQNSEDAHGQISEGIRFEPYKSGGDRMTLVSHRQDIKVLPGKKPKDRELASPVVKVATPEGNDFVYQQRDRFTSEEQGRTFTGRAGVIREFKDGRNELTLFKGEKIGNQDLVLDVGNPALGVSASYKTTSDISGNYYSYAGGKLTITLPKGLPTGAALYVNGNPVKDTPSGNTLTTDLPAGGGFWQLTTGSAVPMAPEITGSIALADGAAVFWKPVVSATEYRVELSKDGGLTWSTTGMAKVGKFTLSGIKAPAKVHLRVIALNGKTESLPGKDFPVHDTGKPAEPPAGLRLRLAAGEVTATWGRVLGAKEYILYRRAAGDKKWKEIHRGAEPSFRDQPAGVPPFRTEPGLEAAAWRQPEKSPAVYEYTVSAVDGTGEGAKSFIATTDPSNWRNWYPPVPLHYIRRSAYWLPPYVKPEQVPPADYPQP